MSVNNRVTSVLGRIACRGILAAVVLAATPAWCEQLPCNVEAQRLGQQILDIKKALTEPASDEALASIVELGTDSRYYTLVRGWLAYELEGLLSILAASEPESRPDIALRAAFITQAIRAIDLE